MSWLTSLFATLDRAVHSPKVKAVESEISKLVPLALPIVEGINAVVGSNRTVATVTAAYEKYAVPLSEKISTDPATALRDLAAGVLKAQHAPDAATGLLNTAVELAVQFAGALKAAPAVAS